MLYIYVDDARGHRPEIYTCNVSGYFDNEYEPEWFSDPYVKRIIREIDKSEVIGEGKSVNIYNEFLGNFSPMNLSSGCKCLILLHRTNLYVNGNRLGDNCFELLLDITSRKDVHMSLSHHPPFPDKFEAIIENTGQVVHSDMEFASAMLDIKYARCYHEPEED